MWLGTGAKVLDVDALVVNEKRAGLKNLHVVDAAPGTAAWRAIDLYGGSSPMAAIRLVASVRASNAGILLPRSLAPRLTGLTEKRPTQAQVRALKETLDREAECVLLVHRRDVIEPVEIRDVLEIRLVLHQLLGPPMQEPDMRIGTFDDFAVKFEDESQHAVRRRVLRTEIDREVPDVVFAHDPLPRLRQGELLDFSSPGST